jgi:hypothetical protein
LAAIYTSATLNLLSGLIMYWILSGLRLSFTTSGYGLALTIGGIAGLIAWALVIVVVRDIFNRMKILGQEIRGQGSPPSPEQGSEMQALVARLGKVGQLGTIFLVIALLGMSAAQYLPF